LDRARLPRMPAAERGVRPAEGAADGTAARACAGGGGHSVRALRERKAAPSGQAGWQRTRTECLGQWTVGKGTRARVCVCTQPAGRPASMVEARVRQG
jgi:hypothetical protein